MQQGIKVIEGCDMVFASALIWNHRYRQIHTGHTETNRFKHITY